jgi:hypothetical protein
MNEEEDVDAECVSNLAQFSGRRSDSLISDVSDVGLFAEVGRNDDNGVLAMGTTTEQQQQNSATESAKP